jgi:penicillin-binding protein-related factor A (putative recombinase)
VSDILGLYQGRFLAIEVKRPSVSRKTGQFIYRTQEELIKKASPGQVSFIDQINKSGGCAFLADSLEVVKEQMLLYFPSFQN